MRRGGPGSPAKEIANLTVKTSRPLNADWWNSFFLEASYAISILDSSCTVIAANPATMAALNKTEEEVVGRKCHDLFHGSDRPAPACPIERIISEGGSGSARIETEMTGRTYLISCTPVRERRGKIFRIVHVAIDITEPEEAQRAAETTEEQFRSLVETTSDWVWKIDKDGFYVYASPRVRDILGYEPEEIIGKTPFDLMSAREAKRVAAEFREISKSLKSFARLENINRAKDGRLVNIETNGSPTFDGRGNLTGYMGFDRDVTEHRAVMTSLAKREKELRSKTVLLEEADTALKVLLKQREEGRKDLENTILDNMKKLVFPYIEKLKTGHLDEIHAACVSAIESNLNSIISPFQQRMAAANPFFTPTELQVADLIERGKTSKEIAKLLCVSKRTVDTHRDNIRVKLALRGKKANLRTHLASLKKK